MKKFILAILVLLFTMSCVPDNGGEGGTEGSREPLSWRFDSQNPPSEIKTNYVNIDLPYENTGLSSINNLIVYLRGYSPSTFTSLSGGITSKSVGTIQPGSSGTIRFSSNINRGNANGLPQTLTAHGCYQYSPTIQPIVCLDDDPTKCSNGIELPKSQDGHLRISNINFESQSSGPNSRKLIFTIRVSGTSNKIWTGPIGECYNDKMPFQGYFYASASLPSVQLNCAPIKSDNFPVSLDVDGGTFICTGNINLEGGHYYDTLTVKLNYNYKQEISKGIRISGQSIQ